MATGFIIPEGIKVHDGSNEVTTEQLFVGKKVVLFGLPGKINFLSFSSFLSFSLFKN